MRFLALSALLLLAAQSAVPAAVGVSDTPERVLLRNDRLALALGKAEKGAIVSLTDNATGMEFIAPQTEPRLFRLTFSRTGNSSERVALSSADATDFQARLVQDAKGCRAELQYAGFAEDAVQVWCRVSLAKGDPLARWRIGARFPASLRLEEVQFPYCALRAPLASDGATDALVMGNTKGGIYRRPVDWKPDTRVAFRQPGSLAAQFACYYADRAGLYTAAYDAKGYPKDIEARRTTAGLEMNWNPHCYASSSWAQDFDVALTTFRGKDQAADWRDAADIYKEWALRQPWCARTFAARKDIPRWLKEGPAMVRFGRNWLADPGRITKWLRDYWGKNYPAQPLITAYWGWEKVDAWITPDYFPVYPSDEQFRALAAQTRKQGCHVFLWPSGYHWTLTYNKKADDSFQWDDRARFAKVGEQHAVRQSDGSLYIRKLSWLRGGETACMCPGDPWTRDWWNKEIAMPLAQRGADIVQVDQVVGGSFPFCYRAEHGHPAGPGAWMTEAFAKHLQTMAAACRKVDPNALVCYEEPNERFNHLVAVQDYRDCESSGEWASVFNYLYHEYLPTFQSNPRANDTVLTGYCLANGEMPHLIPSLLIGPGPLLLNGDFEEWSTNAFTGWDHVGGYQGKSWNGSVARDTAEKHGGSASLRLDNTRDSDIVQMAQNVTLGSTAMPAKKYRLSAWMKTESLARPNSINWGALSGEIKPSNSGRIPLPAPGAGWQYGSVEFTVEGAALLRIMLHIEGPARVWIDDVKLEEVRPDGSAVEAQRPEMPPDHALMRQWVTLYHGAGRPYLQHGRMLHPPKLSVARISYRGREIPAVFHNAFRAADGSEAVVLVNISGKEQDATLSWKGKSIALKLAPDAVRLIK